MNGLTQRLTAEVFASGLPFVIIAPQYFREDFAQDLNRSWPPSWQPTSTRRAWSSSALHPGPGPGTPRGRGTRSRPPTGSSTLPCSGSWPSAPGRPRSSSTTPATRAASRTTRRGS
jgi:hypothetical protein